MLVELLERRTLGCHTEIRDVAGDGGGRGDGSNNGGNDGQA